MFSQARQRRSYGWSLCDELLDNCALVKLVALSASNITIAVSAFADGTGVAIWGQSFLANELTPVTGNILRFDLLMQLG